MLAKALMLLSGNAAASVLLLARNLIVARLIPVEDYGIAATFAVTMALVEMSTQFGLQQQIIQSKDGENIRFQSALQGFQVMRGVLAGAILFLLAAPIAAFLRITDVAWAYQVMAVLPILRAFQHFDIHRLNRALRYGPMLLTGVIPAVVSLVIVWPLALWLGDYRVMLFALVVHEALGALTSHLVAERPYKLVFDRAIMAGSLRFGWPLLLNGMLLFLVMQGDKLIVGRELGMVALGIFGMGITLTLTPTLILAKTTQNFFLPLLTKAQGNIDALHRLTLGLMSCVIVMAILSAVGFMVFGNVMVAVLLAPDFAALGPLLFWLAMIQAFRLLKVGPTIVAIASGHTNKLAFANIPRVLFLLPVAWLAQSGADLQTLAMIAVSGEALGLLVLLSLSRSAMAAPKGSYLGLGLVSVSALTVCVILNLYAMQMGLWSVIVALVVALPCAIVLLKPIVGIWNKRGLV
jgi:O-antigen/teichoic acid export membrane protein